MNIKLLKKQISRGEYELVEIDLDNKEELDALMLHNKEVNHKIYEEKKLCSKYSLEIFQEKYGDQFPDENSDPLEKLIKEKVGDYETLKEEMFEEAKKLLGQAMSMLTKNQSLVIVATIIDGKSIRQVSRDLSISYTYAHECLDSGMKKLKKFFVKLPDYTKYFPNLNK